MPIKFPCPHCKQSLSIRDELAGKTGRCPRCQQTITVPTAGAAAPAAAPTPAKAPNAAPPPAPAKTPAARPPATPTAPAARTAPAKKAGPPPVPPPVPPKAASTESTSPPPETTAPAPVADAPGSPEDVEAEAAALFSDRAEEEAKAPATVDFNCPFCDAPLHLPADLAGKKSPCPNPECRRIIKVPELVKTNPKDWRQARTVGPSMAKVDAGPAPEGTWDSTTRSMVGGEALREAGIIVKRQKPRTVLQKMIRPVVYGTIVLLLGGGGLGWYSWWARNREGRALKAAKDYAGSSACREKAGVAAQAALYTGIGEYHRRTGKPGCATQARNDYDKALAALGQGADSERDAARAELASALLELGGSGDDVQNEKRISWDDVHKRLQPILSGMNSEGRFDTLRVVSRGLIARGQADRVLPLAGQLFPSPEADKARAIATVGLELLAAGDTDRAGKAADQALEPYKGTPQTAKPPVSPAVVTLALALNRKEVPQPGKGPDESADHFIGEVEGLARLGQWDKARAAARKGDFSWQVHFRALVGLAAAAVDAKTSEAGSDVEAALTYLDKQAGSRRALVWEVRRLMELGQRAGLGEDRLRALAEANPDPALRGRAQIILFRAQLARSKEAAEESAAEQAAGDGVAQLLAFQSLARHNTRREPDWARGVSGWNEPRQAFGWLGVALGLQDRDKGP